MSRHRPPMVRWSACAALAALALFAGLKPARAQLVITPTFGSSITSDPNGAAIQAVINSAIAEYNAKFSDPINVLIQFNEMNSGLGQSTSGFYNVSYATFLTALKADAKTADDATANATLPNSATNPVTGTGTINVMSANLRAVGLAGAPAVSGFDGVIDINTHITDIGSPGTTGQYSLKAVVQHEIDEVLAKPSSLPGNAFTAPFPMDLFRYSGVGVRSYTTATASNVYFSIDGGVTNLAGYHNTNDGADFGDWDSSGSPRVQDAYGTVGASPSLGVELTALDVIGYDRVSLAAVPEPGPLVLASLGGVMAVLGAGWRRRGLAGSASRVA